MASIEEIKLLLKESSRNMEKSLEESITKGNKQIFEQIGKVNDSISKLSTRMLQLEKDVVENTNKSETNTSDIQGIKFELAAVQEQIKVCEANNTGKSEEITKLKAELDDQIDRGMRETLVFHGIPGNESSWDSTKDTLSNFLSDLSDKSLSYDCILESIVRAHRGGKDKKAIIAKFNNNAIMDKIKSLRFKNRNVYINQLRSKGVSERIKMALLYRRNLQQSDGKNSKMFVNDNIQLMIKKEEFKYSLLKQF